MFGFFGRSFSTSLKAAQLRARALSTLALIEPAGTKISPGSLSALTAAQKLGGPVTALVCGSDSSAVASDVSKCQGIDKVLVANGAVYDHGLPEIVAALLAKTVKDGGFSHVVSASSAFGRNVVPRAGALLDLQPITDVVEILGEDEFVRPIYAGNALSTVKSKDPVKLITIRATAFDAVTTDGGSAAIEDAADPNPTPLSEWVSEAMAKNERPDLGSASKVVSGGRGLKTKENFEQIIYPLADKLGAAVGASRAAVDSGFADNALQVGQTGKVVAPELYVAVGISGAIQHLAGMKDSKIIAAVNKDPDAPIFQVADVGLVGDLFETVPEITKSI